MSASLKNEYLNCLAQWIPYSRRDFHYQPDRPGLACYGTGYDEWGVQTNQKAFAAYAVLAADPDTDEQLAGMSREALLGDALALLRFVLYTHLAGDYRGNDNTRWGHTWLTSVGTERMMHGVEAIEQWLEDSDKLQLRKVLVSESDWLLDFYDVLAGRVKNNRPESNIWNGSILWRTAAMYPDEPRADAYRRKSQVFLANGFSVDYDRVSQTEYDGIPLSELYVGDNMFPSFALGHHEYLNMGYIVISLSQMAMLYYFCRNRGIQPPDALCHHMREAWEMVRKFTFPDGRLLRIGGDNRVRYCYCQDYLIPTWVFMQDYLSDTDCAAWERHWLDQLQTEVRVNGDGSFLSRRCFGLYDISPLYYTRLEADRACALSMGAYWRGKYGITEPADEPALPFEAAQWEDEYHGASFVKGKNRSASWVWLSAERPTGLCVPTFESNLAEWRENLSGSIQGMGRENGSDIVAYRQHIFSGGFVTAGVAAAYSDKFSAENQRKEIMAVKHIACAALPDDQTMVVMQHARTVQRCYLKSVKGLYMNIPNDIFNGSKRVYHTRAGKQVLAGCPSAPELLPIDGDWVNVDDKLSCVLLQGGQLSLYRPDQRQIGIKPDFEAEGSGDVGMLYCDELCCAARTGQWTEDRGTVLFDTCFVVQACVSHQDTTAYTADRRASMISLPGGELMRAALVTGNDRRRYICIANFGETTASVRSDYLPQTDSTAVQTYAVPAKTAVLLQENQGWIQC